MEIQLMSQVGEFIYERQTIPLVANLADDYMYH